MKRGGPIRIAVVGLGWVATHRHIPAIRKDGSLKLVGLVDRNPQLARQWARKLGVREAVASEIEGISWLDEVDAIDVATSPMSHHRLIMAALRAGKHVITEKPFAMAVTQGEEMVREAEARDLRLCVVHNFQFAPATQRLIRDVERGRLGPIRTISAVQFGNPSRRLPTWYESLPSGLFYDESPHLLYLVRRLAPGLRLHSVDVCRSTIGNSTPASIDASYRAPLAHGEIPVTVSCRFEAPISEWHVAVMGDRGAGILDVFRNIYLYLPNDGAHEARQVLRTSIAATVGHWAQHLTNGPLHIAGRLLYGNESVFSTFSDAILAGRDAQHISGRDALDVLGMQWGILDACREQLSA